MPDFVKIYGSDMVDIRLSAITEALNLHPKDLTTDETPGGCAPSAEKLSSRGLLGALPTCE